MLDKRVKQSNTGQKVATAVALMAEALKNQPPVIVPAVPSWMRPVKRRGISPQCEVHGDCSEFIESQWLIVSVHHPDCIARTFIIDDVRVFFIYQGISELSAKIGKAQTECAAWKQAAESLMKKTPLTGR